jgi:hypothetical protein
MPLGVEFSELAYQSLQNVKRRNPQYEDLERAIAMQIRHHNYRGAQLCLAWAERALWVRWIFVGAGTEIRALFEELENGEFKVWSLG